jgi:hypothetical protein
MRAYHIPANVFLRVCRPTAASLFFALHSTPLQHFDHDKWARHRCTNRYWRHLKTGLLTSRIVKGLAGPLNYVGLIAFAVSSYEWALARGMLHDIGLWHWPSISVSIVGPFSLSTFALSLLLVFRTNGSYQR